MKKFLSITKTAKETGIAVYTLRLMKKRGELPGYYAGETNTWFMVDVEELLKQIQSGYNRKED